MAAPDPNNVLRIGGRVSLDPSNFSAAWPYGGTALGTAFSAAFAINSDSCEIDRVGREEPHDILYRGESPRLSAVFSEWSDDLTDLFPNAKTGGSGSKMLSGGQIRAGALLSAKAAVILFSPFDETQFGFIALHRALPVLDLTGDIRLGFTEHALYQVTWVGIAAANGKTYSMGLKADVQSELGL